MQEGLRVAQFRVGGDEFVVVSEPMVAPLTLPPSLRRSAKLRDWWQMGVPTEPSRRNGARARGRSPIKLAAIFRKLAVSSRSELIARLVDLQAERRGHQRGP